VKRRRNSREKRVWREGDKRDIGLRMEERKV
jgi:hypothetical protein